MSTEPEEDGFLPAYWTPYGGQVEWWVMLFASGTTFIIGLGAWLIPTVSSLYLGLTSPGEPQVLASMMCCGNGMVTPAIAMTFIGAVNLFRLVTDMRREPVFDEDDAPEDDFDPQ